MRTKRKTFAGSMAGCVFFIGFGLGGVQAQPAAAPVAPAAALDQVLRREVCGRMLSPVVFSTRDTTLALSLPADEPAMVLLQVTVGKNGKVKEKLTRVNANHIAGYVAPAFIAATKALRVDRSLLTGIEDKDTSLILPFPLECRCVLDTMSKAWPVMDDRLTTLPLYLPQGRYNMPSTAEERNKRMNDLARMTISVAQSHYVKTEPTRLWYYLAFIKD